MSFLGIWAVKNVRGIGRTQVVPELSTTRAGRAGNTGYAKDRQLVRITLINVSVHMICNVMLTAVLMYQAIIQYQAKTLLQSTVEIFLLLLSVFISYIPNCGRYYINSIVSRTF